MDSVYIEHDHKVYLATVWVSKIPRFQMETPPLDKILAPNANGPDVNTIFIKRDKVVYVSLEHLNHLLATSAPGRRVKIAVKKTPSVLRLKTLQIHVQQVGQSAAAPLTMQSVTYHDNDAPRTLMYGDLPYDSETIIPCAIVERPVHTYPQMVALAIWSGEDRRATPKQIGEFIQSTWTFFKLDEKTVKGNVILTLNRDKNRFKRLRQDQAQGFYCLLPGDIGELLTKVLLDPRIELEVCDFDLRLEADVIDANEGHVRDSGGNVSGGLISKLVVVTMTFCTPEENQGWTLTQIHKCMRTQWPYEKLQWSAQALADALHNGKEEFRKTHRSSGYGSEHAGQWELVAKNSNAERDLQSTLPCESQGMPGEIEVEDEHLREVSCARCGQSSP